MFHIFQQQDEVSGVIFNETCETLEELHQILQSPTLPVVFVYNQTDGTFSHSNGHYTLEQQVLIVEGHVKR